MRRGWEKSVLSMILLLTMCCFVSLAAESGGVLSFGTEEKGIVVYIQNPGGEYEISCQIGTSEAESVTSHSITEEAVPLKTIILLDNSLSVVEKYRPTINQILSELAANRMVGELFTVATFSEQISYIVQDCSDYAQVKQAIDGIRYHDQETYLTDVLYDMLTELNTEKDTVLKRIVIISDGVDNKSIGYTKEELYALLEKTPYPIYTVGCTYGKNQEQLKSMFALSRMTGGTSYLLDDVSDPMTVVSGVSSLNQAVKVMITPKEKDCDGTKKGIGLTVTAGGQTKTSTMEITMPFHTIKETTMETTTMRQTEPVTTESIMTEPEKKEFPLMALLIGGGVVLILFIGGVVFFLMKKREKENRFVSADTQEAEDERRTALERDSHHTTLMGGEGNRSDRPEGTVLLWGKDIPRKLILEDMNNPIKRFEVSITSPVLVGYHNSCQVCLNYEETVSGNHCRIYGENGKYYVENLSKTNGTLIDGKRVVNTAEIYTGCVLFLGKLKMKVEIR